MQQSNSLPYLNLTRQVSTLDRTVQMLVQYQRLLYVELLHIKRKLGMEDPVEPDHIQMSPQQQMMMMQQQMMSSQPSNSRHQINQQMFNGASNHELDMESIKRALSIAPNTQPTSTGRSRRLQQTAGNAQETVPMTTSTIDN